jgi:hypothetical protein
MNRSPVRRIAALGLVALLQVGAYAHLEMLCLPAAQHAEVLRADSPSAPEHHAHHGGAVPADDASTSETESEHSSTHGQCNLCCCPTAAVSLPHSGMVGELDAAPQPSGNPQVPSLSRASYLLPYPNPPPTV